MKNAILGALVGALLVLGLEALAASVTHTVPSINYSCTKWGMRWMADGTRDVNVSCNDAQGNEKYHVQFVLDATNVKDRFGNVLFAQPVGFKNALSTVETQIDNALLTLEASGALSPP